MLKWFVLIQVYYVFTKDNSAARLRRAAFERRPSLSFFTSHTATISHPPVAPPCLLCSVPLPLTCPLLHLSVAMFSTTCFIHQIDLAWLGSRRVYDDALHVALVAQSRPGRLRRNPSVVTRIGVTCAYVTPRFYLVY